MRRLSEKGEPLSYEMHETVNRCKMSGESEKPYQKVYKMIWKGQKRVRNESGGDIEVILFHKDQDYIDAIHITNGLQFLAILVEKVDIGFE